MNLLSIDFWKSAFIGAVVTMICIYVIKKVVAKVEIPVVSNIVENV